MPIEIRELLIKVNIADKNEPPAQQDAPSDEQDNAKIIEECVRQVMEILKRSAEK